MVYPQRPAEKTYNELVEIVTKHYNPTPSVTIQRYKFNSRKRGKDESISDYVAALSKLSEFCLFGERLNDILRDRLILGVNHKKLQHRLLSEPDVTFAKSLQIARTMEAAEKNTQQLKIQQETRKAQGRLLFEVPHQRNETVHHHNHESHDVTGVEGTTPSRKICSAEKNCSAEKMGITTKKKYWSHTAQIREALLYN